jgi:hypothetical protein
MRRFRAALPNGCRRVTVEDGPGNDLLLGGAGSNSLLCGDGTDTSGDNAADDDTSRHCELQAP